MSEDWQISWHKQLEGKKAEIGQVYLGQSLHLILDITKTNLTLDHQVHVELQTGSQRCTLLDQSMNSTSYKLDWEVKEAGVHVLACSISSPIGGASRSFHKFTATSPFQLRTRSHKVNQDLLVAAQLTNITLSTFYIESIHLAGEERNVEPHSGQMFEFRPRSSYQYVFQVKEAETLGRLDIRWRTDEGDKGHLQTAPLVHSPSNDKEPISLICTPGKRLQVNEPGEIQLTLTNNTRRPLVDVFLGLGSDHRAVLPIGEPFVNAGTIEPQQCRVVTLPVIPVAMGVIDVDNLVLGFTDEWVKQRLLKTIRIHVDQ